jgi:hypothetical protein
MSNVLYDLHNEAINELSDGHRFNWKFERVFNASDLNNMELVDVTDEAAKWRLPVAPAELYFSHGQFYEDGVQHIVQELKDKPTSNRALYSLLGQKVISGSGDAPIPSFMSLQCQIEGETLYCTCCFRALEVGKFLRVNLEEIRQTLVEIHTGVPRFSKVHLTIFAFHAYVDAKRRPLTRPEIEVINSIQLLTLLTKGAKESPVKKLAALLDELSETLSAVSSKPLQSLVDILRVDTPGITLDDKLVSKKEQLLNALPRATKAADDLAQLRKSASRGEPMNASIGEYRASLARLRHILDA